MLKVCVILLDSNDKNISLAFLSSFSSFSCYLDDIFSAHTLYIAVCTPYMIYMFGFVTSAELPSIYYVALWWAATILLRLLICIVCWWPLSHQRVFRPKSQSSPVECLGLYIYILQAHTHTESRRANQAKRHRLLWQQQKNDSFSSRVRNIYSNYGRTLYTVCLLIACDASVCALSSHQSSGSFSDVFIIRICIGRLSSPLTHSSVIICGTLASHVTSAFRDAVESIRHVSGHILTHVLTTATTQHPTLIRIAGARFLILFDLGFMRLQSPAYSLSLISSTVLCIEFVWLDALKLKCLET